MTSARAIMVTKAIFWGLLLGALLPGATTLGIITASIVIAVLLFILIVAPRPDFVWSLAGAVIGTLVALFVPGMRFTAGDLAAIALVFLVTWI